MTSQEIREKFLKFYESKGHDHKRIPSASLVPEGDSTTLFTGSGMQPMMPYLLGAKHPLGNRIVDSQKSFRAEDIEEVGDNRHTTFFEMLGNWSFGDYWKEEQLSWLFEFLTKEVGLPPERLYVSVFAGDRENNIPRDEESPAICQKLFGNAKVVELITEEQASNLGMQDGKIFYYGSKKNWLSRAGIPSDMPVGEPGGPDSEVFYRFDVEHDEKYGKYCHPNCDCGQFMEIGNNVFMEYQKNSDGTFSKLPQRNVDFGGGLERITAASNNDPDIFKVDTFQSIMAKMNENYGWDYSSLEQSQKFSMRIVADHLRAAVFMIADGLLPSNKLHGYVLRRLMCRAIFNAYKFAPGFSNLYPLVPVVVNAYADFYPGFSEKTKDIQEVFENEESKFMQTLKRGEREIERRIKLNNGITGKDAFDLLQTYGYPWELTKEIAESRGFLHIGLSSGFEEEFKKHQELSRTASAGQFKGGLASGSDK